MRRVFQIFFGIAKPLHRCARGHRGSAAVVAVFALGSIITSTALGQGVFQSNATGNWNVAGTWTLLSGADADGIPDANDNATILSPHTVTLTVAAAATNLTVDGGGTLNTNANTLASSGSFTLNGSWTGTGTVTLTGAGTSISGTGSSSGASTLSITTGAKSIVAGSSLSFAGNIAITGAITVTNNGTVSVSGNLSGTAAGSTWLNAAGGSLLVAGTVLPTGTLTATANPNTVTYNGAAAVDQTIKGTTYHHLTIARGASNAALVTAAITTNGDLTITSGTLDARGVNVTVSGATSVSGILTFTTSAAGTKTFVGLVAIQPGGSWTNPINEAIVFRGGLTHNGTTFASGTGAYTFNTNSQTIDGSPIVFDGALAITGAITVTNKTTVTVVGNLTGSVAGSTWLNDTNSSLSVAGAMLATGTLTANANPNTVTYNGTAAVNQIVKGTTYHDLVITRGAANVALINAITTVNNNLTVSAGTLDMRGANVTVSGATSVSGILTFSTSAVGTKTFVGPVNIQAGGSWTNPINEGFLFRGGLTHDGTTFTAGTGIYTFDTNAQAVGGTGTLSIPNITVTGVSLTNTSTLTITASLNGTGELINGIAAFLNLDFAGAVGINTLTATSSGNTVDYGAAGAQTTRAINYENLTFSNTGVKTLAAGTTGIAVTFSITGAATADATTNSSTVDYNGGSPQTLISMTYFNLVLSGGGPKTTAGAITAANNFSNSVITTMGIQTLTIAGGRTNTGTMKFAGALNGVAFAGGIVEYDGTGLQTVTAGTYNDLVFTNSGEKQVIGATTATGNVTVSPGTPVTVTGTGSLQVDGLVNNAGIVLNQGTFSVGN